MLSRIFSASKCFEQYDITKDSKFSVTEVFASLTIEMKNAAGAVRQEMREGTMILVLAPGCWFQNAAFQKREEIQKDDVSKTAICK